MDKLTSDPIYNFLLFYKITPGKHRISNRLLYRLYKLYDPTRSITQLEFTAKVSIYLTQDKRSYMLVSKDSLKIGLDFLNHLETKKRDRIKSPLFQAHFEKFLRELNIQSGSFYIKDKDLFEYYINWQTNKKTKISLRTFIQFCKINFKTKQTKNGLYFAVSDNLKNIRAHEETSQTSITKKPRQNGTSQT